MRPGTARYLRWPRPLIRKAALALIPVSWAATEAAVERCSAALSATASPKTSRFRRPAPLLFQSRTFHEFANGRRHTDGRRLRSARPLAFPAHRFQVGKRFETTAIGGLLVPGPQADGGPLKGMKTRPGGFVGIVSGVTSRSHYAWAGTTYQRYAAADGDRRPDLLFYSFAYAYRPESWRKDNGWDWRIFGEMHRRAARRHRARGRRARRQPEQPSVPRADDSGRVQELRRFSRFQFAGPPETSARSIRASAFAWLQFHMFF